MYDDDKIGQLHVVCASFGFWSSNHKITHLHPGDVIMLLQRKMSDDKHVEKFSFLYRGRVIMRIVNTKKPFEERGLIKKIA